jgi:hypothetical protein
MRRPSAWRRAPVEQVAVELPRGRQQRDGQRQVEARPDLA